MDNKSIANIFYETADLMKVAIEDGFRIRSYERAAEALEGWPQQVSELYQDGEGVAGDSRESAKSMAANIRELMHNRQARACMKQMLAEVSPINAGAAQNFRAGTEDHCADLGRLSDL